MTGKTAFRWITAFVIAVISLWGGLAMWYQLPSTQSVRIIVLVAWTLISGLAIRSLAVKSRNVLTAGVWLIACAALLIWWAQIKPKSDRNWAPEVSHIVSGTVSGGMLDLDNIRDFVWRTTDDYTERWISQSYDLSKLSTVDAILSTWGMDAIAHLLVSFGFSDGRHLVFSVEIRKETHEEFSNVAGLFKDYELAIIAATERDIVQLRTSVRREDVSLYPIDLTPEQARKLLLSYVETANNLQNNPKFYHTISANCTTVVFDAARQLWPNLGWDWRIILSGYLPDYLADQSLLLWNPLPADLSQYAAITQKGQDAASDYSTAIRQH